RHLVNVVGDEIGWVSGRRRRDPLIEEHIPGVHGHVDVNPTLLLVELLRHGREVLAVWPGQTVPVADHHGTGRGGPRWNARDAERGKREEHAEPEDARSDGELHAIPPFCCGSLEALAGFPNAKRNFHYGS